MGETPVSTGSGGGTDVSAPTSFSQVSWTETASPAVDPSGQTTTSAATEQPPSSEATPATDDRSPFIPRSRFDEVNARMQAAEAWKQSRAWADSISEADFRDFVAKAQRISADPIAHVQDLIAELQSHPQHSQTLRSLAAKALASGRGQGHAAMPEPDVAITDAAGNVVGQTYSAQRLAERDQWLTNQLLAKVDERFAPVVKTHEDVTRKAQEEADRAAGTKFASDFTAELKDLYPTFDQHKTAVGKEVVRLLGQYPANDPRTNDPAFLEAITLRAAQRVIGASTRSQAESAVLDSLKKQAAASSAVNPSSAVASTPKRIDSFKDLPRDAWG